MVAARSHHILSLHLSRPRLQTSSPTGSRNLTTTYFTHANMSAAMRQKLQELVKPIGSQEEWDEFIQNTAGKKLLVIDIHKKWCGPCEVMRPTFERIFLNTDDCDQKAEFLAIHSDAGISQLSSFTEKATSKPFFVLWKENEVVAKVDGANAPELSALISENIPSLLDD